jgi:hypothetical protein
LINYLSSLLREANSVKLKTSNPKGGPNLERKIEGGKASEGQFNEARKVAPNHL